MNKALIFILFWTLFSCKKAESPFPKMECYFTITCNSNYCIDIEYFEIKMITARFITKWNYISPFIGQKSMVYDKQKNGIKQLFLVNTDSDKKKDKKNNIVEYPENSIERTNLVMSYKLITKNGKFFQGSFDNDIINDYFEVDNYSRFRFLLIIDISNGLVFNDEEDSYEFTPNVEVQYKHVN